MSSEDKDRLKIPSTEEARSMAQNILAKLIFERARQHIMKYNITQAELAEKIRKKEINPYDKSVKLPQDYLTSNERDILKRDTYGSLTQGILVGLACFVVSYAGVRYFSNRKLRNTGETLIRSSSRKFSSLDSSSGKASPSFSGNQSSGSGDGVASQLHLILCSFFSVTAGYIVYEVATDYDEYFRHLAVLPLQPGKSQLCQHLCPDLIEMRNELLSGQHKASKLFLRPLPVAQPGKRQQGTPEKPALYRYTWGIVGTTTSGNIGNSLRSGGIQVELPKFDAKELMEDPTVERLENLVRLVQNCEQRMKFIEKIKQERASTAGSQTWVTKDRGTENREVEEEIIEIPPPGVPAGYLQVKPSQHV